MTIRYSEALALVEKQITEWADEKYKTGESDSGIGAMDRVVLSADIVFELFLAGAGIVKDDSET